MNLKRAKCATSRLHLKTRKQTAKVFSVFISVNKALIEKILSSFKDGKVSNKIIRPTKGYNKTTSKPVSTITIQN